MEKLIMDNGKMVKNMEKEFIIIKMVMYIQDGLHLEKNKVKELIYSILLVKELKDNGKKIKLLKENGFYPKELTMKVLLKIINLMDKEDGTSKIKIYPMVNIHSKKLRMKMILKLPQVGN